MTNVHFVGSVALDSPEEVFAAIGRARGPYLKRVPDGEPGGRRMWISWHASPIYPAYEAAMRREVERLCRAIPHEDLAVQWDVCIEMIAWDGR